MSKRTEIEMRKAAMLKIARSMIRLKHSLRADDELNEKLDDLEQAFDLAVNQGILPDDPEFKELISGVLDDGS